MRLGFEFAGTPLVYWEPPATAVRGYGSKTAMRFTGGVRMAKAAATKPKWSPSKTDGTAASSA